MESINPIDYFKLIWAGLAVIWVLGGGIGIGIATKWLLDAIARNPENTKTYMLWWILWMALAEGTSIYALVIAFMILFK